MTSVVQFKLFPLEMMKISKGHSLGDDSDSFGRRSLLSAHRLPWWNHKGLKISGSGGNLRFYGDFI